MATRGKCGGHALALKGASWLLLCHLLLVLSFISWSSPSFVSCVAQSNDTDDDSKCQKAKEIDLLQCQHGGELYSALNASRVSCSRCDCPAGGKWTGIDCSLCTSVHSCPDKGSTKASGCTAGSGLKPTIEELEQPRFVRATVRQRIII
jgi:hypothetical protein